MTEGISFEGRGPAAVSVAEDPALGLDHRAKLEILFAIMLGLFLGALDQTVVGTALPKIVTDLGGNDYYVWVVTIYLLTSTITVPYYGALSDLFGRRPLLMAGIALFLAGSALSGLSQTMWQLVLFRGIQGIGAGALFPISLAVIGDLFSPAERGKYQGFFGAVFGLSFLVGPWLGGFLTDNVSWHWVFYVNLPIGLLSLFVIWRLLPNIRRPDATRHIDWLGGAVFAVAVSFFLVGLTNKQGGEWTDPVVGGFIAIGLALGALFVLIESRARVPIIPLDLWKNRTYVSSMLATFFVSFGFFGAVIFLPRWFQVVRHESATNSGYQLLPLLIGLIGASILSGLIVARTGRYKLLVLGAIATMAIGVLLMTNLRTDTDQPTLWLWMFITGIGIGPTLSVFTIIVQNAVPFQKLGVATSNLTFFRQIGGSVGLAIAGTVFGQSLRDFLPGQLKPVFTQIVSQVPPEFQAQAQAGLTGLGGGKLDLNGLTGVGQSFGHALLAGVPAQFQPLLTPFVPQLDRAFNDAFTLAVAQSFQLGVVAAIAAIVAALVMRELPLRRTTGAPATAGEATPSSAPSVIRPAPSLD